MADEDSNLSNENTPQEETDQDQAELTELSPQVPKHPLENRWSLWYFKNDKTKDWSENLQLVHTFGFVEDFWALYHYIQPASRLSNGCDYSVFKEGIRPEWEDERNKKGGRWMIPVNKNQRIEELDQFWLNVILCMIGEAFGDHSDEICGAVVNIRARGDKVGVWTANATNKAGTEHIGKKLKESLNIPAKIRLGYQLHDDSMSKTGSTTRNMYTV